MSTSPDRDLRQTLWSSAATVATSSATLICCALPALLVTIGAGAALAGLVTAFPALIWLSMHKAWVFGIAGVLLLIAGTLQWRARSLPCPIDPIAAQACTRVRRWSSGLYGVSVALYLTGVLFAFVLPAFNL
jgi:hypothetical protein